MGNAWGSSPDGATPFHYPPSPPNPHHAGWMILIGLLTLAIWALAIAVYLD
jgi:hypothetical protein